jgi:hypothetical protein
MEANGKDLVDFWAWASKNGLMNGNTAGGLRSACKEVISAVAGDDGWEELDLTTIDPEDYALRFERLRMSKFKPASLGVYKARFKNGLQMYLDYLSNPSGWRYTAERPARDRKRAAEPTGASGASANGNGSASPTSKAKNATASAANINNDSKQMMIEYPFPMRPDCVVTLSLPDNMTAREAERLGAFLKALAYDAPRELTTRSQSGVVEQAS